MKDYSLLVDSDRILDKLRIVQLLIICRIASVAERIQRNEVHGTIEKGKANCDIKHTMRRRHVCKIHSASETVGRHCAEI